LVDTIFFAGARADRVAAQYHNSGKPSATRDFRRANVKKLKVLIVDDSSVMRKIVERALRQAGLELTEVLEASNGAEALTKWRRAAWT